MPLSGNFRSQLKYWAGHAFFCATPSFILATGVGFDSWSAMAAMLSAILLFVCLYALISSRTFFQNKVKPGLLGRAIQLGAKIRSVIALLGLIAFLTPAIIKIQPPLVLLLPDMYCGMFAMSLAELITGKATYRMGSQEGMDTFLRTFLTTSIDGVLLSGTLVVVVLLCLLAARWRSRASTTASPIPGHSLSKL